MENGNVSFLEVEKSSLHRLQRLSSAGTNTKPLDEVNKIPAARMEVSILRVAKTLHEVINRTYISIFFFLIKLYISSLRKFTLMVFKFSFDVSTAKKHQPPNFGNSF